MSWGNDFEERCEDNVSIDYDRQVDSSAKAILLSIDGENHWIPKSQIDEHDRQNNYVVIPEWLAIEKGLV